MTDPADPAELVPKRRLFLAAGIGGEAAHIVAAHLEKHLPSGLPGRPVPPANWHLTLRFLGWTTAAQGDRIMFEVAESLITKPFTVKFGALGAFPKPRRATVLWLGIDRGQSELAELAAVCEEAARDTGFDPEERPYHAHLTVSRMRPPVDASTLIDRVPPCPVKMPVREVRLYESHLQRGQARYEVVDAIEL